jgi:hypothetical protein
VASGLSNFANNLLINSSAPLADAYSTNYTSGDGKVITATDASLGSEVAPAILTTQQVQLAPFSPDVNPRNPLDVDNDGSITATDVVTIINCINSGKTKVEAQALNLGPNPDVDADGVVTATDVIKVINYINAHPGQSSLSTSEGEATDVAIADSDFLSSAQANDDLLNILAAESAAKKK